MKFGREGSRPRRLGGSTKGPERLMRKAGNNQIVLPIQQRPSDDCKTSVSSRTGAGEFSSPLPGFAALDGYCRSSGSEGRVWEWPALSAHALYTVL